MVILPDGLLKLWATVLAAAAFTLCSLQTSAEGLRGSHLQSQHDPEVVICDHLAIIPYVNHTGSYTALTVDI